jgi:4-hydroxy-tetrahydrodipicolinate reductase
MINVCLAGATGWAVSELARGIARTDDITLAAAVSRTHAGRALGEPALTCPVHASAAEALAHPWTAPCWPSARCPG